MSSSAILVSQIAQPTCAIAAAVGKGESGLLATDFAVQGEPPSVLTQPWAAAADQSAMCASPPSVLQPKTLNHTA